MLDKENDYLKLPDGKNTTFLRFYFMILLVDMIKPTLIDNKSQYILFLFIKRIWFASQEFIWHNYSRKYMLKGKVTIPLVQSSTNFRIGCWCNDYVFLNNKQIISSRLTTAHAFQFPHTAIIYDLPFYYKMSVGQYLEAT